MGGGLLKCEPQTKQPYFTHPEFEWRHRSGRAAPQVFDQLPVALGYVTLHADGVVPAQGAHGSMGNPRKHTPQAPVNRPNLKKNRHTAVFHLMVMH